MDLQITQLLAYGGPPLLGAFIGYLTNRVAIRMLFRPLKPWHVLGIRVPMTPGIIPSKRHELAENMGEMVGEHLLTSTDIGAALSTERFQNQLHLLVDSKIKDVLARDLDSLPNIIPHRFRAYARIGIRTLKYQMREGVHNYVTSKPFVETVSDAVIEQLDDFGRTKLNSLLPAENRAVIYQVVDKLIERLFAGPQVVEWLGNYIEEYIAGAAAENKSIADLLPGELQELICSTIESQAPQVLRQLSVMLAEPAVRERIILAIRDGVDNFLDTLGPMGAMARGFIDMDSLEKKIRTYLEDKEEDLSQWLQKPVVQERVARVLVEQTGKFLATPLAQLLDKIEPEKMQTICHQVAAQVMAVLRSQGVQQTMSTLIREHLEEMLDQGRISVAELVELLLPGESGRRVHETVVRELVAMLRSDHVRRLLDRMLSSMVDQLAAKPVGVLHDLMPASVRKGITDYCVLIANRMLLNEVPGLVDSLNITEMVTKKVDSLDLMRLERLLLSIMEEQFKYINLFGALLGFLIGLINLVVLQLY
jgi:uncharacterized membrane protein YheB (UPF0754 family)